MILIGISGKKTSGKTTCAEIIKELFPDKTIIIKGNKNVYIDGVNSSVYGKILDKEYWLWKKN